MMGELQRSGLRRTVTFFQWRGPLLVLVYASAMVAFEAGVGVSERPDVGGVGTLTHAYYALGLFVLGGLDLGVPEGGPRWAHHLLWFAYFAAPTITATALIEGILRAIRPRNWRFQRLRGHVVIGGTGKLAMQYVRKLRHRHPDKPLVLVERRGDNPNLEEAQDAYDALVVVGDINSDAVLSSLRLDHAERLLLLTGDDFVNLDTAAKVLSLCPEIGPDIVVHVSDLHFMRAVAGTRVAEEATVFNTHQIAAEHLVKTKLLEHFQRTDPLDTVVIAGFGRFGQTVLAELQRHAPGAFDLVVLIDERCERGALLFQDEVGFRDDYVRDVVNGDLRDPALWRDIEHRFGEEPVFVIGSGDDGVNLHSALWLAQRYPKAYIVARSFRRSTFGDEIGVPGHLEVFAVADLVEQSLPDEWFRGGLTLLPPAATARPRSHRSPEAPPAE